MAIAFVGSKTQTAAGAVGTLAVSLTDLLDTAGAAATLLQDDYVFIVASAGSTVDTAYTPPATWTEETELYANGVNSDCNFYIIYKKMGGVPDTTVSVPHSGSATDAFAVAVMAFRGVDTTTPLDVASVTATGTGTGRPNGAAITPSTAGSWIVVGGGCGYGVTGAVFTSSDLSATTNHFKSAVQTDTINTIVGLGIKTNWASGAFDPAQWGGGATNANDSWCAITMALRPAAGGSPQTLTPSVFTNSQTFYAPTITASYGLTPALFTNVQSFFAPTVSAGAVTLTPSLFTNPQTFYSPTVLATYTLSPSLFTNTQTFFGPAVITSYTIAPSLYTNPQTFYSPTILATGDSFLTPTLVVNSQTFYSPSVSSASRINRGSLEFDIGVPFVPYRRFFR